jgi:hypothetical protein
MGPMRKWIASFERMLDGKEKEQANLLEREFLEWAKGKLTDLDGFHNVTCGSFQVSLRIMSVDVQFDHADKLFPAQVPTFGNWIVVQVRRFHPGAK